VGVWAGLHGGMLSAARPAARHSMYTSVFKWQIQSLHTPAGIKG
jgi:hypothetical protein